MAINKEERRQNIKKRIRRKISGTAARPRMSVFRSNKQIYVQLIDDEAGKTLAAASSRENGIETEKITKIEQAAKVGALIAEKAKAAGIETVNDGIRTLWVPDQDALEQSRQFGRDFAAAL